MSVILFYRTNGSEGRMLISLVRHQTARPDWIVLEKDLAPVTYQSVDRLDSSLDRRIVVLADIKDLPAGQKVFILTETPWNGGQLVGESSVGSGRGMDALLQKGADWFNRSIAHRRPGDRPDIASHYYLYRPAS